MKKFLCFLAIFGLMLCALAQDLRIVSLSPALTELVYRLGHGADLIGRSSACDFPAEVLNLPVAGNFGDPNVERVIELAPTLVLSNDFINPGVAVNFERRGIKSVMIQCRTIAEYRQCVETVGALLNAPEATQMELDRIDAALKNIPAKRSGKLLWVVWDSPLMIAGSGSLPDEVMRLAGAENVASGVPQAYFKCSFDWLLENQPDMIVWTASPEGWKKHRFWKKLKAVQNGKIISDLNPDLIQRPGPRIFEGVATLRKSLESL